MLFLFNDAPTTEIYTLSLHDALPIYRDCQEPSPALWNQETAFEPSADSPRLPGRKKLSAESPDRKSTRLNSSHRCISYAVFCLKKKKKHIINTHVPPLQ